ncbi:helix-turn-helix domain-containing protein [Pseudoxanthomonas winnipegensis]|nr:helix-turn-helix transcriptional regulator [Pseudoxanthomonas winnipegensis]
MRQRVMNGVCPCCNRTFENLRRHMHDKHPEFGQPETLAALRKAFGLTQRDVAAEAGVNPSYVSLYENGKPVPSVAGARLDSWLQHQEPRRAKGGRA